MGLTSWCRNRLSMMMRTKPQYISSLGRKRSSVRSPPKVSPREGFKCSKKFSYFLCVVIMCCSFTYGMLLVLFQGVGSATMSTFILSLFIAGLASITGGLCLAEYLSEQCRDVPSVYGCCYQCSGEVLAFFVGWTWLLSQASAVAAICRLCALCADRWTDDAIGGFLRSTFSSYAEGATALFFVLVFILFTLTGLGNTLVWYVSLVPLTFLMAGTSRVLHCLEEYPKWTLDSYDFGWNKIQGVDQILESAAVCMLFFSGAQSILRLPQTRAPKNTHVLLGPSNALSLLTAFVFTVVICQYAEFFDAPPHDNPVALAGNVLHMLCLCSLGIDALCPLHWVVEDMAADGLLFRTLAKEWKPCCLRVASPPIQLLTAFAVGLLSLLLPLAKLLDLTVVFPILVNSMVPFLVLLRRYRDNNPWQYEPLSHAAARHDRSRKESHYADGTGFDMAGTSAVEQESSSDTDVDSVVQQYKEQAKVASMVHLDDDLPGRVREEPTASSAFRAKLAIGGLLALSLVVSITLNFADAEDHFSVIVVVLLCLLFSTSIQGLLLCLPQNRDPDSGGCCRRMPSMPWSPGIASLLSTTLLVHCLVQTWKVWLGWVFLGSLVYSMYGIRSSTAATSFHRPALIALRPLPSYGNDCVPRVVPAQRAERPRNSSK